MRPATIDFETRSACDLKSCGSWKYSLDPTTEALCMAYRLPTWRKGRTALWHPAFPQAGLAASEDGDTLRELFQWILNGGLIEAHNAFFERGIWRNIMQRVYGWIGIGDGQWRCSAAKAASHALPRHLKDAAVALRLTVKKSEEGTLVMRKMSSPREPRKAELIAWARQHAPCGACEARGKHKVGRAKATPCPACGGTGSVPGATIPPMPTLWHETADLFEQLFAYCRQDVLAEEALSVRVPDLSPAETALYTLDQQINERGWYLDTEVVSLALRLIQEETVRLNGELAVLTDGAITKATQRARLSAWLAGEGLILDNTQKQTIDDVLDDVPTYSATGTVSEKAKTALAILRELGRSSTAKYAAMQNWVCPDQRVHGSLLFHGATTGRWSGSGVQPHNFPKGEIKKWQMEADWEALLLASAEDIRGYYGSVMQPLSQGLRGAIMASPGKRLFVADYAAIEARVLLWLAEDDDALEIFRSGRDIYCEMATDIYEFPVNKKDHPSERQLGKAAVLGLGYQMGASKFVATAASYGIPIDEPFAKTVVDTYRSRFPAVKQMWYEQEAAMAECMNNRGLPVVCGRITWQTIGFFTYATLPSGRRLAYPFPRTKQEMTPWGSPRAVPTFEGVNPYNHQWQRMSTYGGMIVENLVQAISRDIMADAMKRLAESGVYVPVLTVHDELVAEAHPVLGSVEQFVHLVAMVPDWAEGCPIEAEGWSGIRYHK